MAQIIKYKISGDGNDETIQSCKELSNDLEKFSGIQESFLRSKMEDKLISDFGPSITSTVLSNILDSNDPFENANEMDMALNNM
ncbi:MAG: hypothetical protein HRT87_03820 [Legionellales bacterium]|nr:hypothetical protein [Legionellales bacterium]